jgi:hypothetical protein
MTGSRQRCGERDGEEDETAPKPKLRTGREQHRAGRESATMIVNLKAPSFLNLLTSRRAATGQPFYSRDEWDGIEDRSAIGVRAADDGVESG